jgi:hypothetical protein
MRVSRLATETWTSVLTSCQLLYSILKEKEKERMNSTKIGKLLYMQYIVQIFLTTENTDTICMGRYKAKHLAFVWKACQEQTFKIRHF